MSFSFLLKKTSQSKTVALSSNKMLCPEGEIRVLCHPPRWLFSDVEGSVLLKTPHLPWKRSVKSFDLRGVRQGENVFFCSVENEAVSVKEVFQLSSRLQFLALASRSPFEESTEICKLVDFESLLLDRLLKDQPDNCVEHKRLALESPDSETSDGIERTRSSTRSDITALCETLADLHRITNKPVLNSTSTQSACPEFLSVSAANPKHKSTNPEGLKVPDLVDSLDGRFVGLDPTILEPHFEPNTLRLESEAVEEAESSTPLECAAVRVESTPSTDDTTTGGPLSCQVESEDQEQRWKQGLSMTGDRCTVFESADELRSTDPGSRSSLHLSKQMRATEDHNMPEASNPLAGAMSMLRRMHPLLVEEIKQAPETTLKFEYLRACLLEEDDSKQGSEERQQISSIYARLSRDDRQDLGHYFHLTERDRCAWALEIVNEDRRQRAKPDLPENPEIKKSVRLDQTCADVSCGDGNAVKRYRLSVGSAVGAVDNLMRKDSLTDDIYADDSNWNDLCESKLSFVRENCYLRSDETSLQDEFGLQKRLFDQKRPWNV